MATTDDQPIRRQAGSEATSEIVRFIEAQLRDDQFYAEVALTGLIYPESRAPHEATLRRVAAYRRILSRHRPRADGTPSGVECSVCVDPDGRCDSWQQHMPLDWPCPDVRDLASIYSARPGFDPSWTVE
jgi:hypothetical protein